MIDLDKLRAHFCSDPYPEKALAIVEAIPAIFAELSRAREMLAVVASQRISHVEHCTIGYCTICKLEDDLGKAIKAYDNVLGAVRAPAVFEMESL